MRMLPLIDRSASFADSLSRAGGPLLKSSLRHVSEHTGIPIVVVAAVALVMSFRIAKRSIRFIVEVGLALVLVVAATELGWIRW